MKFIIIFYRFLLTLRYKVEIKGEEVLQGNSSKFILPNHQAIVDPQILFVYISKYLKVVPVVSEVYSGQPILKNIFKNLDAIPVSDLSAGSRDTKVLNSILFNTTNALKNDKNVLLYPSGQIAGQGYEKIFNKQSAWTVVCNLPENTKVIGVRINGLWGSIWSKAWTGKSPNFTKTFLKGILYAFANFILFIPKRKITIEFCDITAKAKEKAKDSKFVFNSFLEEFYNKNGEEQVTFLKHYFFVPKLKRNLPKKINGSIKDNFAV